MLRLIYCDLNEVFLKNLNFFIFIWYDRYNISVIVIIEYVIVCNCLYYI